MKCYQVAFLWEEMLSATRVGDSVSSSRNYETDSGYKSQGYDCNCHRLLEGMCNCTSYELIMLKHSLLA